MKNRTPPCRSLRARCRRAALAQYEEGFEQNKIVYDTLRLEDLPLDALHDLLLRARSARRSQKVASYAESAYDDISRQLNFQIPKPINLIYYATHSDFEQTNTLLNFIPEGVGAFALPSRNRMVLPVDLPDEKLQQLIAHELTHVFQFEILFGGNYLRAATTNAPQWLTEGMASYFGNDEDNKDRMVLRDAVLADQVPEIAKRGISGFFAYRFGHAVFDFIAAEWGKDAVREFVFEFRNQIGAEHREAVKRAFNISAEDFDIKFRRYLRQRYLKILTEKGEPIDFGERFKIEDTPSAELSPRAYPSGDFVAAFSTYKEHADVVLMSHAGPQALPEPDEGIHDGLRVPRLAVGDDGPADRRRPRRLPRREHGRGLRPTRARARPAPLERLERRHPRAHRDAGPRPAALPRFSPDGKLVVFRALREGQADIYSYDLASKHHHEPDRDDESSDFAPGVLPGREVDLLLLGPRHEGEDLSASIPTPPTRASRSPTATGTTRTRRSPPTARGSSSRPTATRGSTTSTPINLETGETLLHTNVVAGVFAPTVFVGSDNSEKLVFSAYYKRRFTLYIADTNKPVKRLPELNPAASPSVQPGASPYQPAIEVSVDPEKVSGKPRQEAPARRRADHRGHQHGPDLRLQHRAHLRRQPGGPPVHRRSSSRSPRSRTSTSSTSTSPSGCRRASRSSTTGRTSSRWTSRRDRTGSCATGGSIRPDGRDFLDDLPARPLLPAGGAGRLHLALVRLPLRDPEQRRDPDLPRRGSDRQLPDLGLSFVGDTALYQEWGPLSGSRSASPRHGLRT